MLVTLGIGRELRVKVVVCFAVDVGGKKRPAWDTKGRLEDMEVALGRHLEQNSNLQQQILSSNDRIAQLESMNCQLKGTVQQREEMTSQAHDEIDALRRRIRFAVLMLYCVLCILFSLDTVC